MINKIESNKNYAQSKISTKSSGGAASENGGEFAESGVEGGDFAAVLENLKSAKNDEPIKNSDSDKSEVKDSPSKADKQNKFADKNDSNKSDNRKSAVENSDAAGAANAHRGVSEIAAPEAETSLPPARAMLHIADLERIVSSVRSQTFENNSQVVITLKNSVFNGLQIKLTSNENKQITAELIAGSEKVKAQIDARSSELSDLLKQRGIKLESLQTSVGSQTNQDNKRQNGSSAFEDAGSSSISSALGKSEADDAIEVEDARAYRI